MASKDPVVHIPKCYVYYNKKSGEILSVTNRKDESYEHGIEVAFEDVEKFLTGEWHFSDFQVGYHKGSDKTTILSITSEHSGYAFKNTVFEWISESSDHAECIVEWNFKDQVWNFILSKDFKVANGPMLSPKLVFFVTLDNDPDFLIRTIFVETKDLVNSSCVTVPFESKFEQNIDKIAISSKLVFKNYKLRVVYE